MYVENNNNGYWSVQLTPSEGIAFEYLPDAPTTNLICLNADMFRMTTLGAGSFISATLIGNHSNSDQIPGTVIINGRLIPFGVGFNFIFKFTW